MIYNMEKDLFNFKNFSRDDFRSVFDLAFRLKRERHLNNFKPLAGKSIGMIFAKSSTRTRVSFEVGVAELGGTPLYLDQGKMQVGRGETVPDTAKVLSRYLHGIVIRTYLQSDVEELGQYGSIPVINALTDDYHPCQILADLMTVIEYSGTLDGIKMVFFGDGKCNIANSLIEAARILGFTLVIAAPDEYAPDPAITQGAPNVIHETDPLKAAEDADYLYTDVWVSMGFEEESQERLKLLRPYQVNMEVAKRAKKDVKFLHCLPAHRDEEVSAEVMDSPMSIVFDEAENRLHVQKAVLTMLVK